MVLGLAARGSRRCGRRRHRERRPPAGGVIGRPTPRTARRACFRRVVRESPVCTSEGWMIVLEGATSHPNLSEGGSSAIAPASGFPGGHVTSASRWARTSSARDVGRQRREPALVEPDLCAEEVALAAEQHHAGVEALAALDARHDAQDRVGERATRRLGHARPLPQTRRCRAAGSGSRRTPRRCRRRHVRASRTARARRRASSDARVDRGREPLVRLVNRSGARAAARARRSAGTACSACATGSSPPCWR